MENNATKSIDVTKNALKRILDVIKKDSNSSSNFRVLLQAAVVQDFNMDLSLMTMLHLMMM